ncbi:DUF4188 domain-containing protein [Staphylococcus xylosus]|nr:DUF4188 domain-containing protein [Staphylococcus xylosus]
MNKGRYTVLPSKPITLFLIGLRVNKWYKIHKWLPVLLAMPPMLKELLIISHSGAYLMKCFLNIVA